MDWTQVRQVRSFNRAVTRRIGVLTDDYLGRGRPWGESRLMFEVGLDGADVRDLRERLSLDSGYLSRLLRSLEAQGLASTRASPHDARVRRVSLTRKGLREWRLLESRSNEVAASLLENLGQGQRERLLTAMGEVERLLRAGAVAIESADPAGREARGCIAAYIAELERRIGSGFDPSRGPSAAPQDFMPPNGVFLLARLEGDAAGCVALKALGDGIGEIKRLWVHPSARGLGVAQRLLDTLETMAADMGMHALRLDTNRTQVEAHALYRRLGYAEIPPYNDNPYADHWLEKRGLRAGDGADPATTPARASRKRRTRRADAA